MSKLHLIQMPLDMRALHVWAEHRKLAGRGALDEGRALHHLLAETFGPGVLQPFRLMVAPRSRNATLYGYSKQSETELREMACMVATPEATGVAAPETLSSKPLPPTIWQAGRRLGFDLRVRPVVRLGRSDIGMKKGAEVDAFLAEALSQHGDDRHGMEAAGREREVVYLDWLAARLASAAEIDRRATRLARFQRTRAVRAGGPSEGPDATFYGTLTVTDPTIFADRLARGVGRHRAYGYGMLLLRSPQRC